MKNGLPAQISDIVAPEHLPLDIDAYSRPKHREFLAMTPVTLVACDHLTS